NTGKLAAVRVDDGSDGAGPIVVDLVASALPLREDRETLFGVLELRPPQAILTSRFNDAARRVVLVGKSKTERTQIFGQAVEVVIVEPVRIAARVYARDEVTGVAVLIAAEHDGF